MSETTVGTSAPAVEPAPRPPTAANAPMTTMTTMAAESQPKPEAAAPQSAAPSSQPMAAANEDPTLPPIAASARRPFGSPTQTKISGTRGDLVGGNQFIAGDLDGDEIDDIVVLGLPFIDPARLEQAMREHPTDWEAHVGALDSSTYVFYGKRNFPEQLSVADADAVIKARVQYAQPIGDVNGDGLADFSLEGDGKLQFVFGSKTRFTGSVAAPESALGAVWTGPALDAQLVTGGAQSIRAAAAGDIDGDGCADLLITTSTPVLDESFARDFKALGFTESDLLEHAYLVLGRRGEWTSGDFDKASAAAEFEAPRVVPNTPSVLPPAPYAAGDVDGDGYADVFSAGASNWRLFYGGPNKLTGTLGEAQADALTAIPTPMPEFYEGYYPIGDLDGDGRADLATRTPDGIHVVYGARWEDSVPAKGQLVIASQAEIGTAGIWSTDVDGDSRADLVLGSPVNGIDFSGALYMVRGEKTRMAGEITLDDEQIITKGTSSEDLTGRVTGDILGFEVHARGDVNGDGRNDVLIGAPGREANPPRGYIVLLQTAASEVD